MPLLRLQRTAAEYPRLHQKVTDREEFPLHQTRHRGFAAPRHLQPIARDRVHRHGVHRAASSQLRQRQHLCDMLFLGNEPVISVSKAPAFGMERRLLIMTKIYVCDICGAVALNPNLVCGTRQVEVKDTCCGRPSELDKMSPEMKEHLYYVFGGCGRLEK